MFFLIDLIAFSGIWLLPWTRIGVTSTSSHSMGVFARAKVTFQVSPRLVNTRARAQRESGRTLAALKMSLTDSAISGPIPGQGELRQRSGQAPARSQSNDKVVVSLLTVSGDEGDSVVALSQWKASPRSAPRPKQDSIGRSRGRGRGSRKMTAVRCLSFRPSLRLPACSMAGRAVGRTLSFFWDA